MLEVIEAVWLSLKKMLITYKSKVNFGIYNLSGIKVINILIWAFKPSQTTPSLSLLESSLKNHCPDPFPLSLGHNTPT